MKMHTLLQNLTLALSLMSAVVTPTVYAADVTESAKSLFQKSYGTFIEGIAKKTTASLAGLKGKTAINAGAKESLESDFSNMAFATIYGIEKDAAGRALGRFAKETEGKATAVTDERVQNILLVCQNLAAYLHQFETVRTAANITERIYRLMGQPRLALDDYTVETEFSYQQRLMLLRITSSYYKKMEASFDVASIDDLLKAKMGAGSSAPKLPNATKDLAHYWAQTNRAMQVVQGEMNKRDYDVFKNIPGDVSGSIAQHLSFPESKALLDGNPALKQNQAFWAQAFPHVKSMEAYLNLASMCYHNFDRLLENSRDLANNESFIAKIRAAFKEPFADGLVGYLYVKAEKYQQVFEFFDKPATIINKDAQAELDDAAYQGRLGFTTEAGKLI